MNTSCGKYITHHNDIFKGMLYLEEEKRGFDGEENLLIPGRYEIDIAEGEEKEISFICTLEKLPKTIDAKKVIKKETVRLDKIVGENEKYKSLIIASDNFIAKRDKLHTIIAGYPWFLDWSRDTFISFHGLVLATGRLDIAKDILKLAVRDIKLRTCT